MRHNFRVNLAPGHFIESPALRFCPEFFEKVWGWCNGFDVGLDSHDHDDSLGLAVLVHNKAFAPLTAFDDLFGLGLSDLIVAHWQSRERRQTCQIGSEQGFERGKRG